MPVESVALALRTLPEPCASVLVSVLKPAFGQLLRPLTGSVAEFPRDRAAELRLLADRFGDGPGQVILASHDEQMLLPAGLSHHTPRSLLRFLLG